jgi:hypothetical protein
MKNVGRKIPNLEYSLSAFKLLTFTKNPPKSSPDLRAALALGTIESDADYR